MRRLASLAAAAIVLAAAAPTSAAPPPESAHPRLFLDEATLASMRARSTDPASAVAKAVAHCRKGAAEPREVEHAVYQGESWARFAADCGLAWQLTRDPSLAAVGVRAFRALLDDYVVIGDGKGGDDVVRHDTGYAIRYFGAYAGLAYDWLHDAPAVDEALLRKARGRFSAWVGWYDEKGYLPHVPGSNYEAGYVYAKTMIAIAASGESPEAARWLADVEDRLIAKDLVEKGLGPGGALAGGDWPEGWQYGALSSLELALVTKAVGGRARVEPLRAWASDVVLRYVYALTPSGDGLYVGGDTGSKLAYLPPMEEPLLATMIAGSDEAAAWATALRARKNVAKDAFPALEALAEARGARPVDFHASARPLAYLASGTRTLFARSSWEPDAVWTVFSSPPRLVPDHQHFDASTFVLSRGADALVVDPSPYGSRSTATSNALAIDSAVPPRDYRGTQTPDGTAELVFATVTRSGVVAARSDLAAAFAFKGATDVKSATRDFVVLPEGEVVVVDRAETGSAERGARVRFRTPASLALRGDVASGDVGDSRIAIHDVSHRETPSIVRPNVVEDASGPPYDYEDARLAVSDWKIRAPGPSPVAVHVIDALAKDEAPAEVTRVEDDPPIVAIRRGAARTYVAVANGALTYGTSGQAPTRHVVLLPGSARVTASPHGEGCDVRVTPASDGRAQAAIFRVSAAAHGCSIELDPPAPFASVAGGTSPRSWDHPVVAAHVTRSPILLAAKRVGKKKLVAGAAAIGLAGAGFFAFVVHVLRRRSHRRASTAAA